MKYFTEKLYFLIKKQKFLNNKSILSISYPQNVNIYVDMCNIMSKLITDMDKFILIT